MVHAIVDGVDMTIRIDELNELFHEGKSIKVLSKNLDSGEISYQSVTASAKTGENRKLLKITDSVSGKSIKVTPNHKVWTKNRGWVEAGNLTADDELDIV
jgi:intein/homing endonuclease